MELQDLLHESLESGEFGPFLDWLVERDCVHLQTRIVDMLELGEDKWLFDVYFSAMSSESLAALEARAAQANRLLGRAI